MRVLERGGRHKKETDFQLVPRAPQNSGFVPATARADVLFETVRHKRTSAFRGL